MISSATKNILNQLVPRGEFTGDVDVLFKAVYQDLDHLTPNALIGSLVNVLAESNDGFNPTKVKSLIVDLLARDRHTGYFIHPSLKTIILDFAKWCAQQPLLSVDNEQFFLIHGDFMNLSSVNDAIDRAPTNDVMAIICGIYQQHIKEITTGCLLSHRSMGDEVSYIALKTNQKAIKEALRKAEILTQKFVEDLGLERLKHKKYPHQYGMGLVTAIFDLKKQKNEREIKQFLDSSITKIKKKDEDRKSEKDYGIEPERLHNRSSETRIKKAIKAYETYKIKLDNDAIKRAPPSIEALKQTLNGHAISWPRDDRIEYLREHHDGTKMMMRADIFNLAGLNNVFGNEGADSVKNHIIKILYDIMESRLAQARIFDCGGGIIDIVCSVMNERAILDTAIEIQQEIYQQILQIKIADYAEKYDLSFDTDGSKKLCDIPHPRMSMKGTGIVMATHKVKPYRSLPEIIERLDKITNRTKNHGFAFLGYTQGHNVVGFLLNQPPNIKNLGADDVNESRHYLPFTKALKRHINPDDVPDIFTRPIGQICEIVFGTDMQAVLGFKKAIRALQDAGVKDEDIEKIKTYDQMDIRLIAADLPPLSVVSTQKRPSHSKGDREAFMTMSLASKLENLPESLTPYILEIQAIFRLLKLLKPQGRHTPAQSKNILLNELILTSSEHKKTQAYALYELGNIFDYIYASIEKKIPKKLLISFDILARRILYNIIEDMKKYGENSVALLIFPHAMGPGQEMTQKECLEYIMQKKETVIKKLTETSFYKKSEVTKIQDYTAQLLQSLIPKT